MGCRFGFLQNPRTLNPNNQADEEERRRRRGRIGGDGGRALHRSRLSLTSVSRARSACRALCVLQERIAKLEASVQGGGVAGVVGQEELLVSLVELRGKLLKVKAEHEAEKEKLVSENKKLQYQVLHLKRAVQEADNKIGIKTASG
ncbi:unnamed protein product [Sphagnum troendelagicum]